MGPAAVFHNPINFNELPGTVAPRYQIHLLRRIRLELAQMEEELLHNPHQDFISKEISEWHKNFKAAIELAVQHDGVIDPIIALFNRSMQRLLKCSLSPKMTFNQDALLGSDGRLYCKQSIQTFWNEIQDQYRGKCPFDLLNPDPFTTDIHPLVNFMLRWLSERSDAFSPETPNNFCRMIVMQEPMDPVEPSRMELLQQEVNDLGVDILEMLGQMRARRVLHENRVEAAEPVLDQFEEELRARVNEAKERYLAEMAEVGREQQENFKHVEEQIKAVAAEHRPAIDQIRANINKLQEENKNIKNDTANLKQRLAEGDGHISELEKSQINLQIQINDLNQKINERVQERNQSLLVTLAIVVACIVIDAMLPGAGRAANAAAAGGTAATGAGAGAAAAATPAATAGFRMGLEPISNGALLRFGWAI